MAHWNNALKVVASADVVLFILDARMPKLSTNSKLTDELNRLKKDVLIVLNKIDLISNKHMRKLKQDYAGSFFVSGTTKRGIDKLRTELLKRAGKNKKRKLEVGIVGYPNVGKSAVTNILLRQKKSKVSPKSGTTIGIQWASSSKIKILDSPGIIPLGDDEIKLGILGAKSPDRIRDLERVAVTLIDIFLNGGALCLEKFYGIKLGKNEDSYGLLIKIGKEKKLLKKGGVVDEKRTASMIIRDWQRGKLKFESKF